MPVIGKTYVRWQNIIMIIDCTKATVGQCLAIGTDNANLVLKIRYAFFKTKKLFVNNGFNFFK